MRVLLIYKKSMFAIYGRERRDARFLRLMRKKDPSVARIEQSHREHLEAMAAVKAVLAGAECEVEAAYRARIPDGNRFDLVVTLGGDGTLLEAARSVGKTPVLGVNSSPSTSFGFFCGATAETFGRVFDAFRRGRARMVRFTRMQVAVNGKVLPHAVLNDVLFCHRVPAATSRYLVTRRGRTEDHRSSGIWWSTAAGSTAAIRSAGGDVMPVTSRRIQFLVREPCMPGTERYRILRGYLRADEAMAVCCKMRTGMIYMDGPHLRQGVHLGDVVTVRAGGPPLRLVAFDTARRKTFARPRRGR